MLLTDKLIELGKDANPKNNLSMGNQAEKMLEVMKEAKTKCLTPTDTARLWNQIKFAIKALNKAGYKYYTEDVFVATIPKK
jgi:hypothetical protein